MVMQFIQKLKDFSGFMGTFMGKADKTAQLHGQTVSVYMSYFTFLVRVALLGVAMFIFMWWPVDGDFNGMSFDLWSARMAALPDEVWYFLFSMILGWGATEIVSTRARSAVRMKAIDAISSEASGVSEADVTPVDDFMQTDTALPGASGMVEPDDDFFVEVAPNNPSIDQWKKDAS
jgi:hypothetical protein